MKRPLLGSSPVRFYPEEVLCVLFFGLLLVLTFTYGTHMRGPSVMVRAVINVVLIIAGVAVFSGRSGFGFLKVVRNWAPIVFFLFAYENLGDLVRFINPHDADPVLKRIDEMLFLGVNPTLWLEGHIHPVFSEIMHICYVNYYPFLPVIGLVLYLGGDYHRYRNAMTSVVLGFYLGYIGYMLVPTVGPRFYMADQFTVSVDGISAYSATMTDFMNRMESTRRDCFPSLHTAITVIVTTYAWKYRRWLFWLMLPFCLGIIMATMYLRYHYVIDVIAGLALAAFCVRAGPLLNDWWYRNITGDHVADDYPPRFPLIEKLIRLLRRVGVSGPADSGSGAGSDNR